VSHEILASDIVQAAVARDAPKLGALLELLPETDPLHLPCRALLLYREMRNNRIAPSEFLALIPEALATPPADLELFLHVLIAAARAAVTRNQINEAVRVIQQTKELRLHGVRPALRSWLQATELAVFEVLDKPEEEQRVIDEVLFRCWEKDTRMWFEWKARRIRWAIAQQDFDAAAKDMAEYAAHEPARTAETDRWLAWLRAYAYSARGEVEQGLAIFEAAAPKPEEIVFHFGWKPHVLLLWQAGKLEAAERLLTRLEQHFQSKPPVEEIIRPTLEPFYARIALARRNLESMRQYILTALTDVMAPYRFVHDDLLVLLAQHGLVLANPRPARIILQRLDPHENSVHYASEWARLYLLEGDEARAAAHFKVLLDKRTPKLAEDKLRYAYEVSPAKVARLYSLADSSPNPPAEPAVDQTRLRLADEEEGGRIELIGNTPAIQQIREKITRFAGTRTSLLVSGETGTGKEVVARVLHQQSPWAAEPFIPINCAAVSETLMESELFGHVKGAFTGAGKAHPGIFVAAGRGTVLLDEIHTMSGRLQAALLRVLENNEVRPVGGTQPRPVHVRVVATTNESLSEAVKRDAFRKDLYYRLARLHIAIPPLRERVADILPLARHFLRDFYEDFDVVLGEDLREALKRYSWPGNVRELRNEVERIVLTAENKQVLTADLFYEAHPNLPETSSDFRLTQKIELPPEPPSRPLPVPSRVPRRMSTLQRRRKLRALFDQHHQLTRAEVIDLLQCAPDTATRDLKALEKDAYVRRVLTSSHIRTSYFEKIGSPLTPSPDNPHAPGTGNS